MVRAAQKGEGASSPEVAKVAASMKKKDAKDFASTKHKGLPMKKEEFIKEEDYDRMKDRRMERGGVGGNRRYDRPPARKATNAELGIKPGKTQLQKDMEKKHGKGKSAMDIVRAEIEAKHGKGAIMNTKKEGYAPGDVDQKVGAVTAIPKDEQDAARARILAKAKAKREARLKKEQMLFNGVDVFEELADWEIAFVDDDMIEDIVIEVFTEELTEGRHIDEITDMLCESVDYSLSFLTEVSDSYYDSAVKSSKEASKKPEVKAANRRAKLEKIKSTAKKVGSALKSGLKTGAKLARKGAVKGAEVAGKAAGHAKNLAKDMGSAAKKGYDSTQKSSSSSSDSDSSSSSSSSSSEGPKKPGLLSRIGSKLKRGIKKAVGAGARSLSRGARNVARKLGEETIVERGDFWHPDPDKDKKLGGPGANQRAREDRAAASKPKEDPKKLKKGESYMDYHKRQQGSKKSSYMSSGSTARERLQKAGAKLSPPKERKRDKIARKVGNAIDRIAGIKKEEVVSFKQFIGE